MWPRCFVSTTTLANQSADLAPQRDSSSNVDLQANRRASVSSDQDYPGLYDPKAEHSACGVGFVASRTGESSHEFLRKALNALSCVEHRGASAADMRTGDGSGVMTDIPYDLLGMKPGTGAVASLFLSPEPLRRARSLRLLEDTFAVYGIKLLDYRPVPLRPEVVGPVGREGLPDMVQAIFRRPHQCRTDAAFNNLLYDAKQLTGQNLKAAGQMGSLFFTSLSTHTIVYKGLTVASQLPELYPDLVNPRFRTRFAVFHRRFSTNTRTSWDKVQPFRVISHNGEINTIAGNQSWSYAREQALGVARDALLTHQDVSDSGNLSEMVEALRHRSSIRHLEDVLAILIPPAMVAEGQPGRGFYEFWGRAVEPWDGPALVVFADGITVGARLDRNGFRPCRWSKTEDAIYVSSEAGVFNIEPDQVTEQGTLQAGRGVTVVLDKGLIHHDDPSFSRENHLAQFDARLIDLPELELPAPSPPTLATKVLFGLSKEDQDRVLVPMIKNGKEPIGSMGDTAALAVLSVVDSPRSFFDFFLQNFAQVTNPPLDYLREALVTDLSTYLGRRPNVLEPKELLPPTPAIRLAGPVLSTQAMASIQLLSEHRPETLRTVFTETLDATFAGDGGPDAMAHCLQRLGEEAIGAVERGPCILIVTHDTASVERPPVPSVLALRAVVNALNREGLRLSASVIMEAGDCFTTHHVAALIGFGATAVCPYVALGVAADPKLKGDPKENEKRLIHAYHQGLLKVMSKMGISVVRSYQSAKLFTAVGLGADVLEYFPGLKDTIGGLNLRQVAKRATVQAEMSTSATKLVDLRLFKEDGKGRFGEKHGMSAAAAKGIHELPLLKDARGGDVDSIVKAYEAVTTTDVPLQLRDLLSVRAGAVLFPLNEVDSAADVVKTFGSGGMSFGAINAESQRDIFIAMRRLGARANSGEGGENPYFHSHGIAASSKQIASGRFGVTAEYLVNGREIEIKIAQGAKPGEGGQLMGIKVDERIAAARHSTPGVSLISPPPQHDIYSIEDLKQLIYELRQLHPQASTSVKLVAGNNIGTIAVGVVKAGADVIHVAGGSGGTGAATLSSMKHVGLPWELGLAEVHQALVANDLRDQVRLRVDGGLQAPHDILIAALLGAEEYGFGKLLLVGQGCIMARVCELNKCPRGIATQDPKFIAKYRGKPEDIENMLLTLAEGVRRLLSEAGLGSLDEAVGRADLLQINPEHQDQVTQLGLDLSRLLHCVNWRPGQSGGGQYRAEVSELNNLIAHDARPARCDKDARPVVLSYPVRSPDRAVGTYLAGEIARRRIRIKKAAIAAAAQAEDNCAAIRPDYGEQDIELSFKGTAGLGFAAFIVEGMAIHLEGQANDSVGKGMSGGSVTIVPDKRVRYNKEEAVIIGNCALYGATGGRLFIHGVAGDRFAVRNSGSVAVAEGAGLHACEYMTGGTVVILGEVFLNVGAGMTGGTLFLPAAFSDKVNLEYIAEVSPSAEDHASLTEILRAYEKETGSLSAIAVLKDPKSIDLRCWRPI